MEITKRKNKFPQQRVNADNPRLLENDAHCISKEEKKVCLVLKRLKTDSHSCLVGIHRCYTLKYTWDNSGLQRFTNKWTNGLRECNVSFCIFGALFSASELKSQDLLASVKHQCGQANIWEPFFFGAKNRSLNKLQAESASKQGWNAS